MNLFLVALVALLPMSQLNPANTTPGDIASAALRECGAWGVGQTPLADDISDAIARLQWMLQQWERKRWFIWHLVDYAKVSTGAQFYTLGPGGDFDTNQTYNPFNNQFTPQFSPAFPISARPNQIESSFLRQLVSQPQQIIPPSGSGQFNPQFNPQFQTGSGGGGSTGGAFNPQFNPQFQTAGSGPGPGPTPIAGPLPNFIDYPMTLIRSREDYNKIALKSLMSFPGYVFYDSAWPVGVVYPWPVPQANIYELHITVREQLPPMFYNTSVVFNIPYEYYNAMIYNLALRLRPKYGIQTMPGDALPGLAKDSLNIFNLANFQISRLSIPGDLQRPQLYNIFSDRMY